MIIIQTTKFLISHEYQVSTIDNLQAVYEHIPNLYHSLV